MAIIFFSQQQEKLFNTRLIKLVKAFWLINLFSILGMSISESVGRDELISYVVFSKKLNVLDLVQNILGDFVLLQFAPLKFQQKIKSYCKLPYNVFLIIVFAVITTFTIFLPVGGFIKIDQIPLTIINLVSLFCLIRYYQDKFLSKETRKGIKPLIFGLYVYLAIQPYVLLKFEMSLFSYVGLFVSLIAKFFIAYGLYMTILEKVKKIKQKSLEDKALVALQTKLSRNLNFTLSRIYHEIKFPISQSILDSEKLLNNYRNISYNDSARTVISSLSHNIEIVSAVSEATQKVNELIKKGKYNIQTMDLLFDDLNEPEMISSVNINSLLQHAVINLKGYLEFRNKDDYVDLKTTYTPNSESEVQPLNLTRVFLNLLKNAWESDDFSTDRQLKLRVKSKIIKEPNKRIKITFEDNGRGIPLDLHGKIFEKGFTTKGDGSGIGLYECRSILESHDGDIFVESPFDDSRGIQSLGTRFTVIIPKL